MSDKPIGYYPQLPVKKSYNTILTSKKSQIDFGNRKTSDSERVIDDKMAKYLQVVHKSMRIKCVLF